MSLMRGVLPVNAYSCITRSETRGGREMITGGGWAVMLGTERRWK